MLVNSPSDFDYLQIGLASPERIRFWSYGEVEKPETINYRTFKPERRGLFCEKIFGPVKDWECSCGKYRRVRYRGIVCERCGVEVTHSKVRRERMGHIELAAKVAHIWFLKGIPSYLSVIMDMPTREVEEVIYYDSYIVTGVDPSLVGKFAVKDLVDNNDYFKIKDEFGDKIQIGTGAESIKEILKQYDLKTMCTDLRNLLPDVKGQKRAKLTKQVRVIEALAKSGNRPEWMVLEAIPVMPPDLRPMVQLEGGRFATSDLNDLYRRVVNRNNRLRRLIDIGAPEMIIRNEKRMLQESVDVLISNGKRGRSVTGANGRPLKSLGNIIEGKQGRFRQNLLGKRVDYSGRSVIVVGPHLKFHQCGLPKEMALELFKPFIIRKLVEYGHVSNVKSAKRKIEKREVVVWDVLEEVIKGQPVLLNRAPTLHRLGIQAFEPILVEGSAIQVHPLVCTAFNADFDGDQMAVHIPLSLEAQTECWLLIMSTNNILSPSSGRSIVTPSQDMVLGVYFLTVVNLDEPLGKGKYFANADEAIRAWETQVVNIQAEIKVRIQGKWEVTSVGRILFNRSIWKVLRLHSTPVDFFINEQIGKKQLGKLVYQWYYKLGSFLTGHLVNSLKSVGFKYSTLSGISISVDDMKIPERKKEIISAAEKEVIKLQNLVEKGKMSEDDLTHNTNEIWRNVTHSVTEELTKSLGALNNVSIMANSGARGNMDQVRQLAGMRGLMSDAQGRTVNIPIKSNFKEGLSITEYFISSYGARKGLVDTALRTADSGYLTRRLVDVAQDVIVTEEDCGSTNFAVTEVLKDGVDTIVGLAESLEGRTCAEDVSKVKGKKLAKAGDLLTFEQANAIEGAGIKSVKTRSIYRCKTLRGVCQKCYGVDLGSGKLINLGEAVGIIAAQSIGEPGTQLTMRTFHTGGVDLRRSSKIQIKSNHSGVVDFPTDLSISLVPLQNKKQAVLTDDCIINIKAGDFLNEYALSKGTVLSVKNKQKVVVGDSLGDYDPFDNYYFSKAEGVVSLENIKVKTFQDEDTGKDYLTVEYPGEIFLKSLDQKEVDVKVTKKASSGFKVGDRILAGDTITGTKTFPSGGIIKSIEPENVDSDKTYLIKLMAIHAYPVSKGAKLLVKDKSKVVDNDILFIERIAATDSSLTKDIVQGLPRVEELFEARRPKESAVLSQVNGVVELTESDGVRIVRIVNPDLKKEYKITKKARIAVYSGQKIQCGDNITEGIFSPHDILETRGLEQTQRYLEHEVQRVYRSQGVGINSKHIELIVRQMTRKFSIVENGDSRFLPNEMVDMRIFKAENDKLIADGKKPAVATNLLLGITRVSLNTDSFVSASSFQQTASVLTKAAIEGQTDPMYGLKENVIIGKLIPAGTGFNRYGRVGLEACASEYDEEQLIEEEKLITEGA